MEAWKRQFIRYLFHYSADRRVIEAAFTVKHPHVPAALHKYRQFSNQHKDALLNGVLWRAAPERFNDPYDSVVWFDQDRFLMEDQTVDEFMTEVHEIMKRHAAGDPWIPKPITKPLYVAEWRGKLVAEVLKGWPAEQRNQLLSTIDSWFKKQSDVATRAASDWYRSGFSVLCLCENATSVLMWSHYANNHTGFCIQYNFATLDGLDLRRRLCYPVFYRRKITDTTRYFARRNFREDFNNLFGTYMCLLKSDEWQYEREWRIVYPVGPDDANSSILMPKPTAIILGAHVRPEDQEWMREYCNTNGVPMKRIARRPNEFRLEVIDAD